MSDYAIEVLLDRLICRDTESVHSSDRFALTGAITTDLETAGLILPPLRINDGEVHNFHGMPIFRGSSSVPKVGLALKAWDIDSNEGWVENQQTIVDITGKIAQAVKLVPGWGTVASSVIDGVAKVAVPIINAFVEWDKDDLLLDYHMWKDLPVSGPYVPTWRDVPINFSGSDPVGYSSWDYTLILTIGCTPTPSLGGPTPPRSETEAAMHDFRHRADVAAVQGEVGGFPNFYRATYGRNVVGGTILVHPTRRSGHGPYGQVGFSRIAEWRDVPLSDLGNPSLNDFAARMRATQDYSLRQSFVGGYPNFHHADYGRGIVCGTVLLSARAAEWRDVPLSELGNPSLDDIGARFRGTHDYALRNGFVGGFPNFYHADSAGGTVCGTILIKKGAGHWEDVLLQRLPG